MPLTALLAVVYGKEVYAYREPGASVPLRNDSPLRRRPPKRGRTAPESYSRQHARGGSRVGHATRVDIGRCHPPPADSRHDHEPPTSESPNEDSAPSGSYENVLTTIHFFTPVAHPPAFHQL